MNRRDFLKLGGLFSTALFVQFNPLGKIASRSVETQAGGKLYRGITDGKILVSTDAGKNWQLHTNFGAEFSIGSLATDLWGQVHTQLEFAGHPFDLVLAQDGNNWRTV